MKQYTNFSEALEVFRNDGGAMYYVKPHTFTTETGKQSAPESWYVGDPDKITEMIPANCTLKEASEYALSKGGMTEEQIAKEMEEWVDNWDDVDTVIRHIRSEVWDYINAVGSEHDSIATMTRHETQAKKYIDALDQIERILRFQSEKRAAKQSEIKVA
jgi:predicted phosphoadenosine phosphosulfate sulfurtransferase